MNRGYRVYKTSFEAAHFIDGHVKCGTLHGHSYNVIIKLFENDLSNWLDFDVIKTDVDQYIRHAFDHKNLGNITCEEIAQRISDYLSNRYTGVVIVNETREFGIEIVF